MLDINSKSIEVYFFSKKTCDFYSKEPLSQRIWNGLNFAIIDNSPSSDDNNIWPYNNSKKFEEICDISKNIFYISTRYRKILKIFCNSYFKYWVFWVVGSDLKLNILTNGHSGFWKNTGICTCIIFGIPAFAGMTQTKLLPKKFYFIFEYQLISKVLASDRGKDRYIHTRVLVS